MSVPRLNRWLPICVVLALSIQPTLAQELPEKPVEALRQLENFEIEQTEALSEQIITGRKKLIAQLRKQQQLVQKRGDLEPALAILKVVKSYRKADPLAQPDIPKGVPQETLVLEREHRKVELQLNQKLAREVAAKRQQVADLLKRRIQAAPEAGGVKFKEQLEALEKKISTSAPAEVLKNRGSGLASPPYLPGLLTFEFPVLQSQHDLPMDQGYVPFAELGRPLGKLGVTKNLNSWRFKGSNNAVAIGYLKIENAGLYEFSTYNDWDRNEMYISDLTIPLCIFRDSKKGDHEIKLEAGYVPIIAVCYDRAKSWFKFAYWKPPGAEKSEPIPDSILFHVKDEAEALIEKNAAALPEQPPTRK